MSFLPFPATTTSEAVALIKQDGGILHEIVHGSDTAEVLTEGGLVPSVNKVLSDLLDRIGTGTGADVTLRPDLADTNSEILVGGVKAKTLAKRVDGGITPEEFGAVGDGVTDDSTAIENWLNTTKPLRLNKLATYRLTREINLPASPIILTGLGRLPVYAYEFSFFSNPVKLPTFLIDHNGSDAFRFRQNSSARGSYFYGFNIIRKSGSLCTRAFGFDTVGSVTSGSLYGYDCTFERLGIFDFISAFDMYTSGVSTEPTMADITIKDCVINRNNWVARNLNSTAWNMFRFIDNKAGQQITGGLDVSAHSFIEHGNLLEGMPNPVKVTGAYEGFNAGGSYFEANTGLALYNLQALRGPSSILPCTVISNYATTVILAGNTSELTSAHPVIGEACYNISAPNLDGSVNSMSEIDPLSQGVSFCSQFNEQCLKSPRLVKSSGIYRASTGVQRAVAPFDSEVMVVEELNTLSGATSRTIPIVADAYDYVVITFMLNHQASNTASTYVTVDINGNNSLGSRDYSFGDEDLHIKKGDWKVYTLVVKPQVNVTSAVVRIYPYGTTAGSGLPFKLSGITVYSCSSINSVRPYLNKSCLNSVTAAPTTGTWVVGDYVRNAAPVSAGQGSYIYTSGGWVFG